jgi:PTS system trehalose-specific IIC component
MSHDYSTIAREILEHLGGSDNLEQAAHCVTRLRLALKDPSLVNNSALNQVDWSRARSLPAACFRW